jgi:hypothetical protein
MTKQPGRVFPRMCKAVLVTLTLLLLIVIPAQVSGRNLHDNVLGLRVGMSRENVHRHLQKMGTLEREERGRQEVWTLATEPRFASVLVGFDGDFKVRYVTAIARDGGPRMRYSDLAPIKDASAESARGAYTRYTWEAKPGKQRAGYFLIAEGRDPEYLKSFSIKRHN